MQGVGVIRYRALLLMALLLLAACQMPNQQLKSVSEDEVTAYLYLQPLPAETDQIRFTITSLAAVRADGVEIPLSLRLGELTRVQMARQRLLASSLLPIGSYKGFSIRVSKAFLKGEDGGEASLLVPEDATRLDFPFEVKKGRALLVSLSLRYEDSLRGVSFTPTFTTVVPEKPLNNLTGYVTNFGAGTITVFDKKKGEAVDAIQTGRGPSGIVLDQRLRRAYVALTGDDAIDVIDVTAGTVVNRIRLSLGDAPRDLALTPDGKTLLSANIGSSTVSIIDPVALLEIDRVNVLNRPGAVLVDRSGSRAFIFNELVNRISVLDLASRQLLSSSIATDSKPLRGDFNRKGSRLVVYQQWSPYLLYIDPFSFTPQQRVNAGMGIGWVKVDTSSDKLYVGKTDQPVVDIYDPFSLMPSDYLPTLGGVSHMAIDGEENNLCLVIPEQRILQIINLVSRKVVGVIELDDAPYWATVVGER